MLMYYNVYCNFQNYAEHTMNELLGLFGYEDKVNSTDTENLNLENFTENKDGESLTSEAKSDVSEKKSKPTDKLKSILRHRKFSSNIYMCKTLADMDCCC